MNLIPEPRTDRNGKTVTRWVKPAAQRSTPDIPAPAVQDSPRSSYPRVFTEFRRVIDTPDLAAPEYIDRLMIEEGLQNLPRHTLSYLDSIIQHGNDTDYLTRTVISAIHEGTPASAIDDCAYLYANFNRNYFDCGTYAGWHKGTGFEGLTIATSTLRGCSLQNIDGLDYAYESIRPMRLQDNDTGSKVLAVFNTLNAMAKLEHENATTYDVHERAEHLADPALTQLVVEHHSRNAELLQTIAERGTLDPDALRLIINHSQSSLSSGVL